MHRCFQREPKIHIFPMNPTPSHPSQALPNQPLFLCGAGIITALLYAAITRFSFACEQSDPQETRPLLTVLMLFTIAGLIYLAICYWFVFRTPRILATDTQQPGNQQSQHYLLSLVIGWAVLFRVILLFSVPVQEVDLYRYIWDGVVTAQGISPYKYSPQEVAERVEVQAAMERGEPDQPFRYRIESDEQSQVGALAKLAGSTGLKDVFYWVHYKQYTTPYPPTNQPFFAIAAILGSLLGNFWGYLFSIKAILILFDLATGFVLIKLLTRLELPAVWSVAWFWCPLVLKEIANSGHLDSIAVFFTTLAVYLLVTALVPSDGAPEIRRCASRKGALGLTSLAICMLALGVGAKIYPIVLLPLFMTAAIKRIGVAAVIPLMLFGWVTVALLWPILSHTVPAKVASEFLFAPVQPIASALDESTEATAPPAGIEAFTRYWEMNDFLFMLTVENLKPYGDRPESVDPAAPGRPSRIWFVRTSNTFRHQTAEQVAALVPELKKNEAPFWISRGITMGIFSLIVLWSCVRVARSEDPRLFLEMAFLTLAWFWLLSPTQNPWYWTWAIPLLCFCRNPAWYLFSVVSLAYYLRFYCEYHLSGTGGKFGTAYRGTALFDFVVPILEFAPLLLLLVTIALVRTARTIGRPADLDSA